MGVHMARTRSFFGRHPHLAPATVAALAVAMGLAMVFSAAAMSVGGTVEHFAGTGTAGDSQASATTSTALMRGPVGGAVDGAGNVYVAEHENMDIRKISGDTVTLFAGSGVSGVTGSTNGVGTDARFNGPSSIAVDSSGNLYVSDEFNNRIRKISPEAYVSDFSGSGTAFPFSNGASATASFYRPDQICLNASETYLYVADAFNNRIRRISMSDGSVETYAGTAVAGHRNGATSTAQFNHPAGLAVDSAENVYVGDTQNGRVRKITPDGVVSDFAGTGASGHSNGTTAGATFDDPAHLALSPDGSTVYVADFENNQIRAISDGVVSLLAGSPTRSAGATDGVGPAASFNQPWGLWSDSAGDLYVGEHTGNNDVRKITVATNYSIVPTAGLHGTISPDSAQDVAAGMDSSFTFTPEDGYRVGSVLVDGIPADTASPYVFRNVGADHTIAVTFESAVFDKFYIVPTAGAHGTITPGTTQHVGYGESMTFTIASAAGYHIADVLVDGDSVGASSTVVFANVTRGHTISASFEFTKPVKRISGNNEYETAIAAAKSMYPGWARVRHVVIAGGEPAHVSDALVAVGLARAYNAPLLLVPTKSIDSATRAALKSMPAGTAVQVGGLKTAVSDTVFNQIKAVSRIKSVDRVGGADRFITSAAVARKMKAILGAKFPNTVLLANGEGRALLLDGAVAAAASGNKMFPLLYVKHGYVPGSVKSALSDLKFTKRYVIGGVAAVPEAVRSSAGVPSGNRIFGASMAGDAVAFANRAQSAGWLNNRVPGFAAQGAYGAIGARYVGKNGGALLVVDPNGVPAPTSDWLTAHKAAIAEGYAFGGTSAVSEPVRSLLQTLIN